MKFSITSTGRDNRVRLSFRNAEQFKERIQVDAERVSIDDFRKCIEKSPTPKWYKYYKEIARVTPCTEFRKEQNGCLSVTAYNGLVVLDVKPLVGSEVLEEVKQRAMSLPTTFAAFIGASGHSVKLLVRVARADGTVPQGEAEAESFYQLAFSQIRPLYAVLLQPYTVIESSPGVRHTFLMPFDPHPRFNFDAVPYRISGNALLSVQSHADDAEAHAIPQPQNREEDMDWERYSYFERIVGNATRQTREELQGRHIRETQPEFLKRMSHYLVKAHVPQEEAVSHIWNSQKFRPDADEALVRSIVESTYDAEQPDGHRPTSAKMEAGEAQRAMIRRLEQRYVFRYNIIMGYTEYRRNITGYSEWSPVTDRVVNGMLLEMQAADIPVWRRDIKNFVESSRIRDYDIVDEYLSHCNGKWDGHDHIRELARTVPTDNPQWPDWFHTWYLGMVAQWKHLNNRFGNAIVPLLVSRQGYHKSDFCRQLLPPELRSWGYTDSLSMNEERSVLMSMTQMLLICLDEFNQISPRKQEGFLKNVIQLPAVKVKRPYGKHIEELPRLASFIATTNQADVLTDPSGSRRFVGIRITGDIDTSHRPNYPQLFAQALYELAEGERYWFDAEETVVIMEHNRSFQLRSDALSFFLEQFQPVPLEDQQRYPDAVWMKAGDILKAVKQRSGAALRDMPKLNKFARELRALPGISFRRTHDSDVYLVRAL